jgi:hypothetical protein
MSTAAHSRVVALANSTDLDRDEIFLTPELAPVLCECAVLVAAGGAVTACACYSANCWANLKGHWFEEEHTPLSNLDNISKPTGSPVVPTRKPRRRRRLCRATPGRFDCLSRAIPAGTTCPKSSSTARGSPARLIDARSVELTSWPERRIRTRCPGADPRSGPSRPGGRSAKESFRQVVRPTRGRPPDDCPARGPDAQLGTDRLGAPTRHAAGQPKSPAHRVNRQSRCQQGK